jgi:N-acetylglutamate synthase-like GNAT family acetyltransferase
VLELASIAVEARYRGQGISRAIIERLLEEAPRPLYLTCRSGLGAFYQKWGFRELSVDEMPAYFRRLARVMSLVVRVVRADDRLLVMVLQ